MGTFGGMLGNCRIAEEKKKELAERILQIFQQGGMMQFEQIKILGKEAWLLKLPEYSDDGVLHVWYNYFENDVWESAGYNVQNADVWSNKIGWRHFQMVINAARVLQEFYSDTFCMTDVDGRVFCATDYIGWFNYLFGESYTNARARDLWEVYKILPEYARNQPLLNLCRDGEEKSTSLQGLQKYLLIAKSELVHQRMEQLGQPNRREPGKVSTAHWITLMRRSMDAIKRDTSRTAEEKLDYLKGIMKGELRSGDIPDATDADKGFAIACRLLSWEVAAKYVADAFGLDFWSLHAELECNMSKNTSEDQTLEDGKMFAVVSPISTSEFLCCSDDDRAFWWKPGGNVVFSQEMNQWLSELRHAYDTIAADDAQRIPSGKSFVVMMDILHELNCNFGDVFAFEKMFVEYVERGEGREYQTSLILLRNLLQTNKAEIDNCSKETYEWDEKRTEAQTQLRRYLAILANVELRQQIFGF